VHLTEELICQAVCATKAALLGLNYLKTHCFASGGSRVMVHAGLGVFPSLGIAGTPIPT